jgi:serine/threonine protein kinase
MAKLEKTMSKELFLKRIKTLESELNILTYIQRLNEPAHPNIIRLIGATTTIKTNKNEFYLVTEYCEYGSVESYVQKKYRNQLFFNEIDCNNADSNFAWKVKLFLHLISNDASYLLYSVMLIKTIGGNRSFKAFNMTII